MSEWNCSLCISVKGPTKTTFELSISLSFIYAGAGDKNVERRHRESPRSSAKTKVSQLHSNSNLILHFIHSQKIKMNGVLSNLGLYS